MGDKYTIAEEQGCIGYARLLEDGSIELDLCSDSAMSCRRYPKSHKQYQYISNHVGELKIGEEKMVRPFPD